MTPAFNEAVGYYRRKPAEMGRSPWPVRAASMRPSDITDGNPRRAPPSRQRRTCFNEAVGYYRRKPERSGRAGGALSVRSMRPSDITDGNYATATCWTSGHPCFNEAVGYYRRKHPHETVPVVARKFLLQ